MASIHQIWEVPKERYSILVLMLLKQLAEHADNHCWHAKVQEWIQSHGLPDCNIAWIVHT